MKKMSFLSLLVCLLVCISSLALAETNQAIGSQITFQNLPWGSSYATVKNAWDLKQTGSNAYCNSSLFYYANGTSVYRKLRTKDVAVRYSCKSSTMVAGYEMRVSFLFAYTVTSPIQYTNENTALIAVEYFKKKAEDVYGVVSDLAGKLSSVYGPCSSTSTEPSVLGYPTYRWVWYGANNTFIVLYGLDGGVDTASTYIQITYGWNDGDALMMAMEQAIIAEDKAKEAELFGNGDTGGL